MELILWRHAKAHPAHQGLADLDRALTSDGIEQAKNAAIWLNERLPLHCRILVSPARRTRQTADALNRPYEVVDALAPDATADDVLTAAGWPKAQVITVVVGHQPTLGEAALHLLKESLWAPRKASLCWLKAHQKKTELVATFTP